MIAKTSDDYAPCIVLYPAGKLRKANCLKERIDTAQSAIEKLRNDYAAWVAYEDFDTVNAALGRKWQ